VSRQQSYQHSGTCTVDYCSEHQAAPVVASEREESSSRFRQHFRDAITLPGPQRFVGKDNSQWTSSIRPVVRRQIQGPHLLRLRGTRYLNPILPVYPSNSFPNATLLHNNVDSGVSPPFCAPVNILVSPKPVTMTSTMPLPLARA